MAYISLEEIKEQIDALAVKIKAPTKLLPSYGQLVYDAHPYIEVDNLGFMSYIISERGNERERKITDKLDDLLFWIFDNVIFSMACDYELENRIKEKDIRRMLFAKQEDLLGQLNEGWQQKKHEQHEEILKDRPFHDRLYPS